MEYKGQLIKFVTQISLAPSPGYEGFRDDSGDKLFCFFFPVREGKEGIFTNLCPTVRQIRVGQRAFLVSVSSQLH